MVRACVHRLNPMAYAALAIVGSVLCIFPAYPFLYWPGILLIMFGNGGVYGVRAARAPHSNNDDTGSRLLWLAAERREWFGTDDDEAH